MKNLTLHLVADYDIGGGRRFVYTFAIDSCNNLARLDERTRLSFDTTDGGRVYVGPDYLHMCRSGKVAREVADNWISGYKAEGRYWDFRPIDRREIEGRGQSAA